MNFFAILLFIVLLRVTYQGVLSTIRVQRTFLLSYKGCNRREHTVFPHIRSGGINFFQGLQIWVLLERGYYLRASIIIKVLKMLI
jgi:hypothetical protein